MNGGAAKVAVAEWKCGPSVSRPRIARQTRLFHRRSRLSFAYVRQCQCIAGIVPASWSDLFKKITGPPTINANKRRSNLHRSVSCR
ncbi:hypothetical protein J6590_071582 [Homalodisca vitripennis]|nr:hypothetical protein J6590_071582 [Homalodisca vitripennis]